MNASDRDYLPELLDEEVELVMPGIAVRGGVQSLAGALLDDVQRIAGLSVARMQESLPSYAKLPADSLIPVTLTNTRNLLEAVCDPATNQGSAHHHFRLSGEVRHSQGIRADDMLQAWRIGLEVVRQEAYAAARRLEVSDAVLLDFVEATLQWGDIGMQRSAAAHREGEIGELKRLTAEQAALRRIATMVARECDPTEVFAKVAEELSRLLEVTMVRIVRFESDGRATVLAGRVSAEDRIPPGWNVPIPRGSVIDQVFSTGGPAHVDDYAQVEGPIGDVLREEGARCGAGGPIVVNGRLWGAMAVGARSAEMLPLGSEVRVSQFAELVSTAISNIESRAKVERLAAEQAALRRVAELVAAQPPPEEVFALVTDELSRLLGVNLMVRTVRFESDGTATILAAQGTPEDLLPTGTNTPRPGKGILDQVLLTGRPGRVDDYTHVTGSLAVTLRHEGIRSAAAGPIVVDGRIWGAMAVGSQERLPLGTEHRVARFAELVSTAISNVESRAKIERLAAEQSALRRVATLVAEGTSADELFALVSEEVGRLFCAEAAIARFEPDGSALVIVGLTSGIPVLLVGTRVALEDYLAATAVYRTGRPARRRYSKGALERFATEYGGDRVASGNVAGGPRKMNFVSSVAAPIVVGGGVWGAMTVDQANGNLPADTEERLESFTELVASAISNASSWGELAASEARARRLAEEQSALRRVATLVARATASERFFSTVAREVGSVLNVPGVIVQRFEADGTAVTFGEAFGSELAGAERFFAVGSRMPPDPGSLAAQVFETHRTARVDDFSTLPGTIGDLARGAGLGSGCAGPIVVNGDLWGKMCVFSGTGTVLPAGTEDRLHDFIELVATAIANYESWVRVERLAAEQSALRRVATLVAREYSPEDLFATLAEEVGVLLEVDASAILRYDPDSTATAVAGWSDGAITIPVGRRFALEGENLAGEVQSIGKARRKEDYEGASGPIAVTVRELGIQAAVASPIVVDGATWGVIAVLSRKPEPLPADTEARLAEFSRHASMAVSNTKSRSDLAESRARIVRAGDEARRRFERDLHDGAQQRLVSLGLELRAADAKVPPELDDLRSRLSRLSAGLNEVLDDLRELSRGLHPAVLSEDGLTPALNSLALRSAVPVELHLDLDDQRFDEPVEVAAYYIASEALANTAKHGRASRVEVSARRRDGWLELNVRDDGKGGADPSRGTGITGLVDRVEAIGGSIHIESRAGVGTGLHAKLPLAPSQL